MDFKELYEKYNWGQVTKEEQEFVESELKRRKEAKENIHEGYESENKNSIEDDVVTINDSREEPERVQKLKGENPTWGDVLGATLGTVVNVNWSRFRGCRTSDF